MTRGNDPAFPLHASAPGMTLRDYFASQALIGMIGKWHFSGNDAGDYVKIAEESYEIADTMLKEREY